MSEMSTLQRTVASLVEEVGASSTGADLEAALKGALGKYRERLALGGYVGSGR
jgi:hypothetical protein